MSDDKAKLAGAVIGIGAVAGIGALIAYAMSKQAGAVTPPTPPDPNKKGSLKVVVTDASTNKAIAGATVTITNTTITSKQTILSTNSILTTLSATTDSTGTAIINDIPEGQYTLTVHAGGYKDYTESIQITANYQTQVNVTLTVDQNNPPTYVNTITLYLRWQGNAYPNMPTGAGISYVDVMAKKPDGTIVAEGVTDKDGKFTFQYAFNTANQYERIDIYTKESVFEPYLPFVLSPSANAFTMKYSSTGSQPPIYMNFDEKNVLYLDITPMAIVGDEEITTPSTKTTNNVPYVERNGNLPLVLTANGYPLPKYDYLFATLYMFAKNTSSYKRLSCSKRGDLVYPDYQYNKAPYEYTKYPYPNQINPYKTSFWFTQNYPAILPKKIGSVNGEDNVIALFQTMPIRVGDTDTTYDWFSCIFVSCAWNSALSKSVFKLVPVKTLGASPTTAYDIIIEGSGLGTGIGIGVWCYHNNPESKERYTDQYLCPQSYGWQVIEDTGVRW
jgi:hypothetical protein